MALTAGTRLGPYEIRDQIGAGGMGEVRLGDRRFASDHVLGDSSRHSRWQTQNVTRWIEAEVSQLRLVFARGTHHENSTSVALRLSTTHSSQSVDHRVGSDKPTHHQGH